MANVDALAVVAPEYMSAEIVAAAPSINNAFDKVVMDPNHVLASSAPSLAANSPNPDAANVNDTPTGIQTGRTLSDDCDNTGYSLEIAPHSSSTLLECVDAASSLKEAMVSGPQLPEPANNVEAPSDVEVVADLTPDREDNMDYTKRATLEHNNFAPSAPSAFG